MNKNPPYPLILICGILLIVASFFNFADDISWTKTNITQTFITLLIVALLWVPVLLRYFFKRSFAAEKYYLFAIALIALVVQVISYLVAPPSQYFLTLLWGWLYGSCFILTSLSKMIEQRPV